MPAGPAPTTTTSAVRGADVVEDAVEDVVVSRRGPVTPPRLRLGRLGSRPDPNRRDPASYDANTKLRRNGHP